MLKLFFKSAKAEYYQLRNIGVGHEYAVEQAASQTVESMKLDLPWAIQVYMAYKEDIERHHTRTGYILNSLNQPISIRDTFLTMLSSALFNLFSEHLSQLSQIDYVAVVRIQNDSIQVVSWD